jgi:hypothetical protein
LKSSFAATAVTPIGIASDWYDIHINLLSPPDASADVGGKCACRFEPTKPIKKKDVGCEVTVLS